MKINSLNNTNFGANLIARSNNFTICKLSNRNDLQFLKDFSKRTDFQKLMPKLNKQESDRWHEMLEYAIGCAENPQNTTYLEILNDKLCGIITCFQNQTTIVDCICTIPIKVGEKTKFAGKTMFYQIFKDFMEYGGHKIKLSAITDGPYNTINKYKDLGFKETSNVTKTYIEMDANQYSIKNVMKNLKSLIPYKSVPQEKIDLYEVITN